MEFLREIIGLLSEPPGSVIYHLVVLFSLQVVFGISYARWRRIPEDDRAQQEVWASGAILGGRLLLLLAGLYYGRDPQQGAQMLPPLERAVGTMSVALLVWALAPRPGRYPRALDLILVATLVLTAAFYLFFAQEWQNAVAAGTIYYGGTAQATVWAAMQIAMLVSGLAYLLLDVRSRMSLAPVIAGTLLVAHVAQLWNYPEIIPTDTNVPYWIRLGNLVAIPLWAVHVYQHTLAPLLAAESLHQTAVNRFGAALAEAAAVIASQQDQRRLVKCLAMATELLHADFVAIGLVEQGDNGSLQFYSDLPAPEPAARRSWSLDLADHATLRAALTQNQPVLLVSEGLGARQLHAFYTAAGIPPSGALLIQSLGTGKRSLGLLVAAVPAAVDAWATESVALLPGLATFIAQALTHRAQPPPPATPVPSPEFAANLAATDSVPAALFLDHALLEDLRKERDQLRNALEEALEGRSRAEKRASTAKKQARYLAAALQALQASPPEPQTVIDQPDLDTVISRPRREAPPAEAPEP